MFIRLSAVPVRYLLTLSAPVQPGKFTNFITMVPAINSVIIPAISGIAYFNPPKKISLKFAFHFDEYILKSAMKILHQNILRL